MTELLIALPDAELLAVDTNAPPLTDVRLAVLMGAYSGRAYGPVYAFDDDDACEAFCAKENRSMISRSVRWEPLG